MSEEIFKKPEVSDLVGEYVELAPQAARFAAVEKTLKEWFGEAAIPGVYADVRIQVEIENSKKVKIRILATQEG